MEIYNVFETIRRSNLEARKMNNYDKLLENAQALSDYAPQIINILVEQENAYRKYEANLLTKVEDVTSGKTTTSSKAEALAKATDNYKEYKRAELMLDWIYETINISKKLATSVGNEYNSTINK